MAGFHIRPARPGDAPALARIYWRAGLMFLGTPHAEVVDPSPPAAGPFARLTARGRILVAAAGGDAPAGFVGLAPAALADGTPALHVAELDMDPAHQRKGGARALLAAAAARARAEGRGALTLTTYRDLPWNGPMYRRLGFSEIAGPDWPPVCRGERDRMAALGLDVSARIAMVRRLGGENLPRGEGSARA